jgi:hypothetical protein
MGMGDGEKRHEPQKIVIKSVMQGTVKITLILEKYDTVMCMSDYRRGFGWYLYLLNTYEL